MGMDLDLSYRILDEGVSAYKQVSYVDEQGIQRQGAKNLVKGALAQVCGECTKWSIPQWYKPHCREIRPNIQR